jgi:hypothetical protein
MAWTAGAYQGRGQDTHSSPRERRLTVDDQLGFSELLEGMSSQNKGGAAMKVFFQVLLIVGLLGIACCNLAGRQWKEFILAILFAIGNVTIFCW